MKYITVKLTEDQALYLVGTLDLMCDNFKEGAIKETLSDNESKAYSFTVRIRNKVYLTLAEAKIS